jgi:uncharacterized membrane protein
MHDAVDVHHPRIGIFSLLLLSFICLTSAAPSAHAGSFRYIGSGEMYGMSADGGMILGSNYATGSDGYWDSAGAFHPLTLPAGYDTGGAFDISQDRSTLVGRVLNASTDQAARWTGAGTTPPQLLGYLPGGSPSSRAWSISADGSSVVGTAYTAAGEQPVRWINAGSAAPTIERLSGGMSYLRGEAYDVSADGSTIVGTVQTTPFGPGLAVRWTASTGVQLLDPALSGSSSNAYRITPDGSVVIGFDALDGPFRWTASTGVQSLGVFGDSNAIDMTPDGSLIVGQYRNPQTGQDFDGFLWDATHGARTLTDMISAMGFDLEGAQIEQADAISADGRIIAGRAFGPTGGRVWVLELPEPGAMSLLTAGLPLLLRRRCRRGVKPIAPAW